MTNTQYTDGVGETYDKPLPTLNATLLEEAVAWATWDSTYDRDQASPELLKFLETIPHWDQESWSSVDDEAPPQNTLCSTTFCIAGYAMFASGRAETRHLTDPEEIAHIHGWDSAADAKQYWYDAYPDDRATADKMLQEELKPGLLVMPVTEGLACHNPDVDPDGLWSSGGEEILGLTTAEADKLFYGANSIQVIQDLAQDIAKSRGLPPLNFDRWTFHKVEDQELSEFVTEISFEETGETYVSTVKEVTA